ncbi:MAG TPA: hypothetical protein VF151_09755 [Gemmatimonadales bacterium]
MIMARRRYVRSAAREERICATVETLAKLRRDPLLIAAEDWRRTEGRDGLSPEHESAVLSIRAAYAIITAPVASRVADLLRTGRAHGEMSDSAARLVDRYGDWADELYRRGLSVYRALDVILDDGEREWHGRDLEAVREYAAVWLDLGRKR